MSPREVPPVKLYFLPEDISQIKDYVEGNLSSGMLTLGEYSKAFEKQFADFNQIKHSVAVSSGTSAFEIVLQCIDLKEDDEVILLTNTFSATAAAVLFSGRKPILSDIDPENLCINAQEVRKRLTPKTKGVIVVHNIKEVLSEFR